MQSTWWWCEGIFPAEGLSCLRFWILLSSHESVAGASLSRSELKLTKVLSMTAGGKYDEGTVLGQYVDSDLSMKLA